MESTFTELGAVAAGMADRVAELITDSGAGGFAELQGTDQAVDTIHARVLTTITGEKWPCVRSATSLALLARFHERFADHAVSVAKRVEFAATGSFPGSETTA